MTSTDRELDTLRMLRRSSDPLTGRQVADILGVAPNTANRVLRTLQSKGLVQSTQYGKSLQWTTTAEVSDLPELNGPADRRTALVVTAVDLEHTEVYNRLVNPEHVRVRDVWMVRGEILGSRIDWTVYLGRAGMGNAPSAALVGLAARELEANIVAFVGIAGGLKPDDHNHSDVIVASAIHNPYIGKQVPSQSGSELLGRSNTYQVPAPLLGVVNACIAESAWTPTVRSRHYNANRAHAFVAPIVSVEAVQTDPSGPLLSEIRSRFQSAAACDMESFGLAAGSDIHDLPVLAVRGISDFVGDKSAAGNDELQPAAAGNAAQLFRDILKFAHPDDFKRGGSPARPTPDPSADQHGPSPVSLPGSAQLWMDRLEHRSTTRAHAAFMALIAMRGSGSTVATWFSRALHRPPAWLREDDTGDGWALVSTIAQIAGSTVVERGFEMAAKAAKLTGDNDAYAYFKLTAWIQRLPTDPIADEPSADKKRHSPSLDDFDGTVIARFGTAIKFYIAVLNEKGLAAAKTLAEHAVATLDLEPPPGVLFASQTEIDRIAVDPLIRNLVAATLLRQLALMMLDPGAADQLGIQSGLAATQLRGNPVTRDLADDGLQLAQWARSLSPDTEGTQLTEAQTMLGVLVSMIGRTSSDVDDEVSRRARRVEAQALQVRDTLIAWHGSSASALAVAARARSIQGDYIGALKLLLPAPNGIALQRESRDPEVVRLAAFIAKSSGQEDLALTLAAENPDRAEGELMRASILGGRPQMAVEAKEALFGALQHAAGRHHATFQALMALCRRFNSLDDAEQKTVSDKIEEFALKDRDLSSVMRARALISRGDSNAALPLVRSLERSELVLETHADALVATGQAAKAVRMFVEEGLSRGDATLAAQALEIAMANGLHDDAREIAHNLLTIGNGNSLKLAALRALQYIARDEGRWQEVVTYTQRLLEESHSRDLPVQEIQYWRIAEAFYFLERYTKALTALTNAPAISFSAREKAQLFLSILNAAIAQDRTSTTRPGQKLSVDLADAKIFALLMRAAGEWANDEQIAAAAISVILTAPDLTFTELQIADFRDFMEGYFAQHGDNASITQISVADDDLGPLIEFLRNTSPRAQAIEELASHVRDGRFPLAMLAEAAGRTCTESLIRRDLGCVLVASDDTEAGAEAAQAALGGRVLVDTTALVVAPWTGYNFKHFAAHMDSVIIPSSVRQDVARARTSLSMMSTTTLGWDPQEQRPVISESSRESAQSYADEAESVWRDVQRLPVQSVDTSTKRNLWLRIITTAQEMGLPVWADDVVLRRLARSMGVPAFGTLDLIGVIETRNVVEAATSLLRERRVVDLPIHEPWFMLAQQAEWRTDGALALAISRPIAWRDPAKSFDEFRALIRSLPNHTGADDIARWTRSAATGLAISTVPTARPEIVSALLVWTILSTDSFFASIIRNAGLPDTPDIQSDAGSVIEQIIGISDALCLRYYPGATETEPLISALCKFLLASFDPPTVSRAVATLATIIDPATGARIFTSYLKSARP
ncbi:helix-turn-helix domain-containing protein [Rhodococcus fascians]|uniref:phosphorylase family protein n=1 Tax=Rhodococcoides fascians TaxID=1828 RepID=UPI0024BB551D|nr:helix-turn-helix domain-containing protein [Rhodococcus fascians]MDJ0424864.1 helix-turn-helix domain-containing protein [Rhodococcus fascians]